MSPRSLSLPVLLSALLCAACTPPNGADAGTPPDGGSAADAGAGAPPDAGPPADAGSSPDAGPSPDAGDTDGGSDGGLLVLDAIPGAHCAPEHRSGLVEVTSWGGGSFSASATLYDRPRPWVGPAALRDDACAHFDGSSATGCDCGAEEACAFGGGCAPWPVGAGDLRLSLRAGDEEQVFDAASTPGSVYGEVTLPGSTFAVELSGLGLLVRAPAMTVPELLADARGVLSGSHDAPTGLDLRWAPVEGDVDVFTHIPMNHHVATPSFTECRVDASVGELHVPGAMLAPLAVSTGLEFQTLEPARFAAVETDRGCIEVRFSVKQFGLGF